MGADKVADSIRRPWLWYVTTAASILVGVLPIWALERWFNVPRKITVGYGILAFVIGATLVKVPLHHFVVERFLRPRLSKPALSAIQGVISAFAELAVAAAFIAFVVPRLTWWQLVGFGVGAGATEAVMLPFLSNPFKGTSLEKHAEAVGRASAGTPSVQWLSVVERVWAMLLQVSTRGLVGLSVYSGNPLPAGIALAGFGAVDGSAYYWHLSKWRFDTLPVLARVHMILGFAAVLLMAAFLWWSGVIPLAAE